MDERHAANGRRLPGSRCLECGLELDAATSANGQERQRPRAGDVTLCIGCGAVHVFGPDLRLRAPTAEERRKILADAGVRRALAGIARVSRAMGHGLH